MTWRSRPAPSHRCATSSNGDIFDVRCRLVVGADGRQSTVRRGLGIELHQEDSKATLGGMLVHCDWPDVTSFIGSEGDCYYLGFPRRDGVVRAYLACEPSASTSGPDRAKHFLESFRLTSLPDSDRIADGEVAGPCSFYIGSDSWTERPVADGVVLIGDAAGWSDPIIGNGLSVAMRDARSVAEVLLAGDDWSTDAFEPYVVERAERMRRLKIAGHVTTVNRCTFTDAGRAQRRAYLDQMMTDPLILGLALTSVIGPETCPTEAFTDENIDRVQPRLNREGRASVPPRCGGTDARPRRGCVDYRLDMWATSWSRAAPQPSTKPIASCAALSASVACITRAVYFVPPSTASKVSTAVKGKAPSPAKSFGREVGAERSRPHEPLVLDDLEETAGVVVDDVAVGRAHHGTEDPAGPQIDLRVRRRPGRGGEPFDDVLGLGPCGPDLLGRDGNDAVELQVEAGLCRVAHVGSFSGWDVAG